ncbi:MAG: regulatory protein RecX [Candidatus Berkelbacteria bacterium]|nr:regulatory protein RecX [Candidatus Berkelbacteria bacterium]
MKEPSRQQKRALNRALFYLSQRSQTQKQIEEKLARKEFASDDIEFAIKKLKDLEFIDDLKFAKNYVRQSLTLKPKGKRRLFLELVRKGVLKDLIEQALEEELTEENEQERLDEVLQKYLKRSANVPREKIYNRALGFLMRRGFSYDLSKKALQDAMKD